MFSQRKITKQKKIINTVYASLSPIYDNFEKYIDCVKDERRCRICNISDFDAKVHSLGGALLLNEAAQRSGIGSFDVKYTEKGKPYIENSQFYFSISHSDGYAACSFGNVPSGCDIQVIRPVNLKIAQRYFSEKEKELVFSAQIPEDAFFKVWCKKESAYKLTGFNDCIVENKHNVFFKEFDVCKDFVLTACGFENMFTDAEKIDLNTAF